MEKLEDKDDNDEIICEDNEECIIKNALGKLNKDQSNDLLINELSECYKSKKKLDRLEDRLIKKFTKSFPYPKKSMKKNQLILYIHTMKFQELRTI